MGIKKFKCGLCKKDDQYVGIREGLRKHLKEEHRIMTEIANTGGEKKVRRRWWIVEDFEVENE
jgi:hypothetical protein